MNRFAAVGLFVEAAKGKRIAVVTHRSDIAEALRCFVSVPEVAEWPGVRIRRANGSECIDVGGRGRITFHSVGASLRGFSADVVLIDAEADRSLSDGRRDEFHRDARAIVAASPHGEIVRA